MKRSLALSTGSALVATAVGVTGFLVSGASAGAQSTVPTEAQVSEAGSGKLLICHKGLGKFKAYNASTTILGLESGRGISGSYTGYRRAPKCRAEPGFEERTRFSEFYSIKSPFRLKSVTVQQSDGAKVTFTHNSRGLRVVMSPGDEVAVTYRWVRPKQR